MFLKSKWHEIREIFAASADHALLQQNGLKSFDDLWSLQAEWVETPNYRRQGWSGVVRIRLQTASDTAAMFYVKRQVDHCYRDLRPPFRRKPTVYREYRNLLMMKKRAINAPDVVYYGERRSSGELQAILVTREIARSISLEAFLQGSSQFPSEEVRRVTADTAALIARLHRSHLQHSALYGKHILLGDMSNPDQAFRGRGARRVPYLIDCEKTRLRLSRRQITIQDLNQLKRHAPWQPWQWQAFLDNYMSVVGCQGLCTRLGHAIDLRALKKQCRHQVTPQTAAIGS